MSKPFNASTVTKTLFGKNNLQVTFVDQFGRTQIVNLSPEARHNLILGLLARSSLQQLQKLKKEGEPLLMPEDIFEIVGITSLLLVKDKPALELRLPSGASVYISFPVSAIHSFQTVLSELENALMSPTTH